MTSDNVQLTNEKASMEGKVSKKKSWFSRWTLLEKIFALTTVILVAVIIGLVASTNDYSEFEDVPQVSPRKESDVCTEERCVTTASDLLRGMSKNGDPCNDFYSYACGNWHKMFETLGSTIYSANDLITNWFAKSKRELFLVEINRKWQPKAVQKALKMYNVCTNSGPANLMLKHGITALKAFFRRYEGWPIAERLWNESAVEVEDILARLTRHGINEAFFKVTFGRHNNKPERRLLLYPVSSQEDVRLSLDIMARKKREITMGTILQPRMFEFYTKLLPFLGNPDEEQIEMDLNSSGELHALLKQITIGSRTDQDHDAYQMMTIEQLTRLTNGKIDWLKFFRRLMFAIDINENEEVGVYDLEAFQKMADAFGNTSKRVLVNEVLGNAALKHFLPLHWTRRLFANQTLTNEKIIDTNELDQLSYHYCRNEVQSLMPYASLRLFVDNRGLLEVKPVLHKITMDVQAAMKELITNSEWMAETTKQRAKEKLDRIAVILGYPEWIMDNTKLDNYYSQLNINDIHIENVREAGLQKFLRNYQEYQRPIDKSNWIPTELEAKARYDEVLNLIYFPLTFFQYDVKVSPALNYGYLGTNLAHEFAHAFDLKGIEYDSKGYRRPVWNTIVNENFRKRTKCLVKQINGFCFKSEDNTVKCVNGTNTLNENIADNIGIQAAFQAFQSYLERNANIKKIAGFEDYSQEQIFFLGTATEFCAVDYQARAMQEPFSPKIVRVNNRLSNFAEFAKTFNCSKGVMNALEDKCILW